MSFASPLWFWLALVPLAHWLWQTGHAQSRLKRFADPALLPWIVSKHDSLGSMRRWAVYTLAWGLLTAALAGPQTPLLHTSQVTEHQRVFVVDISPSMQVADLGQTRQMRMVTALAQWTKRKHPYQTALLAYAAQPHWLLPNTTDQRAFEFYVQQLAQLRPPTAGSRPNLAFEAILAMPEATSRSVVWMSDGDITADEAAALQPLFEQLRARRIPVFIYAFGSADGDLVPDQRGGFLAHGGVPHRSRMQLAPLEALAALAGGSVVLAKNPGANWDQIEGAVDAGKPDGGTQYTQWFWLPLLGAMGALMWLWRVPASAAAILMCILCFPVAQAASFDEAVAAYQGGDYALAVDAFTKAVLETDVDEERGRALYNLGNSYFELGDFARAAEAFADSLIYRPEHRPSIDNQALALAIFQAIQVDDELEGRAGDAVGAKFERRSDAMPDSGSRASINRSKAAPRADLSALDQLTLQGYLDRGRAYLNNSTLGDQPWQRRNFALDDAMLRLQGIGREDATVFIRLFEIEEGIPAPLDAPKSIEGVLPW